MGYRPLLTGLSWFEVLMITHNPEAAAYGDRILHMRDGQLVPPEKDPQWMPPEAAAHRPPRV